MGLAWQTYGSGHLAKSIHGYYLVYRNFDNEMKTNRWFAQYETGSDRYGQQVSRVEFQGFDSLEDAQAFCDKDALDVERALHDDARPLETLELRQDRSLENPARPRPELRVEI
jgi:hypothetical protein